MIEHKFKYEMITEAIRREINDNTFHGKILPSEKELMERYKVGRRTLCHALKILADEGTIARIQSKGSVIMARQNAMTISRQIAVVMSRPNDANEIMYQEIIQEIIERNYFCITTLFDQGETDEEKRRRAIERLHLLLNSPIAGILTLGESYYNYPFMSGHEHIPSVFLKSFESLEPIPGKGVLCDFEKAGYLATSHLARLGHRRISLFFYKPGHLDRNFYKASEHPVSQFESGYRRALKEFNLSRFSQIVNRNPDKKDNEYIMRGMLSGASRPTGIICAQDDSAAKFVDIAMEMNLKVPGDLALIGMYNTPWCQKSRIPLTSISMEEETIGHEAVDLLLSKDKRKKIVKVPPKLIIRDSCGGRR